MSPTKKNTQIIISAAIFFSRAIFFLFFKKTTSCHQKTTSSSPFIDLGADEFNFESFGSQRRSDRGFWRRCDNQARERLVFAFVFIAFDDRRVLLPLLVS